MKVRFTRTFRTISSSRVFLEKMSRDLWDFYFIDIDEMLIRVDDYLYQINTLSDKYKAKKEFKIVYDNLIENREKYLPYSNRFIIYRVDDLSSSLFSNIITYRDVFTSEKILSIPKDITINKLCAEFDIYLSTYFPTKEHYLFEYQR